MLDWTVDQMFAAQRRCPPMSSDLEGRLAHARPAGEAAPELVVPREDAGPNPKHRAPRAPANPPPAAKAPPAVLAAAEPDPAQDVPAPSPPRRVRARLTRRMSGQRSTAPPNRT